MKRAGISTSLQVVSIVVAFLIGLGVMYVASSSLVGATTTTITATTTSVSTTTISAAASSSPQSSTSSSGTLKPFKIVIFDTTTASDPWGVTIQNGLNAAIAYLNNTNGYAIHLTYVWQVAPSDVQAQMQSYASQGYQMIMPNDATYESAAHTVAAQFPNIYFYSGGGFANATKPNLGCFAWDVWRGYFEAGVVAGLMTKSNIIGFVTAFSFANANEGVNAFWAGAKLTNPHVKIVYAFAGSWTDPAKGSAAAASLASQGADVIAGMGGSMSDGVVTGASQAGVYGIGYLHDVSSQAPKALTSVLWNTTSYFIRGIQLAENGTLGGVYLNFKIYPYELTSLSTFHNVPADVQAKATPVLQNITSGKIVEPENATLPAQGAGG